VKSGTASLFETPNSSKMEESLLLKEHPTRLRATMIIEKQYLIKTPPIE
jgi:hypothetical protein